MTIGFRFKLTQSGFLAFALLTLSAPLSGQQQLNPSTLIGDQPYVMLSSDTETINNSNGDVDISIPLLHLPGINGFDLDLKVNYHSKLWDLYGTAVYQQGKIYDIAPWVDPSLQWGLEPNSGSGILTRPPFDYASGTLSIPHLFFNINQLYETYTFADPSGIGTDYENIFCTSNFVYYDESGAAHTFTNQRDCYPINSSNWIENISDSNDTSFMRLNTTNLSDVKVFLKNGNIVHFNEGTSTPNMPDVTPPSWYPSYIEDPNGNRITFTSANGDLSITDSLNRVVTVSNGVLQYYASDGTLHQDIASGGGTVQNASPNSISLNAANCAAQIQSTDYQPVENPYTWATVSGPSSGTSGVRENIVLDGGPGGISRTYTITFDGMGQPVQVTYPSGGYTKYVYQALTGLWGQGQFSCTSYDFSEIAQKRVCKASSGVCSPQDEDVTTYTPTVGSVNAQTNSAVTVVEPPDVTGRQRKAVYTYSEPSGVFFAAREIGKSVYDNQSTLLETVQTAYTNGPVDSDSTYNAAWSLPQTVTTITKTAGGGSLTSTVNYQYDTVSLTNALSFTIGGNYTQTFNIDNPTLITQTDYSGNTIKTTTNTWDYIGPHIWDSPLSSTVSGGVVSATKSFVYDGNGNVTSSTVSGSSASALTSSYLRNGNGQITQITDPKGNATKFGYANAFIDGSCPVPAGTANGPSTVTDALGHISQYWYYSCTGRLAQSKDPNGAIRAYTYDALGRSHNISYPDGGSTTYSITDSAPNSVEITKAFCSGSSCPGHSSSAPSEITNTLMDGLGRTSQTQLLSDPSGNVYTDTTYDALGRVNSVSNPYRASDPPHGITTYTYDALDRKTTQTQPDGTSVLQWCYNGIVTNGPTNCPGNSSSQTGTWADSYDENMLHWQHVSDALGRMIAVMEPNGASASPSMETDYGYDVLGNLLSVNQWGGHPGSSNVRTRSFTYNGLSQLLTSFNPETGTICYGQWSGSSCVNGYDADGNLISKTDARGITVSYSYDPLNRLYAKDYFKNINQNGSSSGDPSVCMQYDNAASGGTDMYPVGRMTLEWTAPAGTCPKSSGSISSIPSTAYNSRIVLAHDSMGRILSEQQCPYAAQGVCTSTSPFNYSYDLAGSVSSFNNGVPVAASSPANPAITWGIAYNGAEQIQALNVTAQPWGTNDPTHPNIVFQADSNLTKSALSMAPYDAWGHLVAEQASLTAPSAFSGLEILSAYDNRGRITSEQALSQQAPPTNATSSFGVIAINGTEQGVSTGTVTVGGAEQSSVVPYSANYCPGGELIPITTNQPGPPTSGTCYDTGGGTFQILQKSTAPGSVENVLSTLSISYNFQQNNSASSIAQDIASFITSTYSTTGMTATANGGAVSVVQSTPVSSSSIYEFASVITCSAAFSPNCSFSINSPQLLTQNYDAGSVQVTISNVTTASVPWGQGSTAVSLASSLASAINTAQAANGNFVTASVGASGYSINLKSTGTGALDNYPVAVNVTDNASSTLFPSPSFQFDATNLSGGANSTAIYDNGTLSALIDGCAASTGYAVGSTSASLASSLATSINTNCPTLVSAVANGSTIELTGPIATSPGAGYSLGSSSSSNPLFSSPSFSLTASGSALTSSTTAIYEGGTVIALLFPNPNSLPCMPGPIYGQGSTAASLAAALASSFNSSSCSSLVSASANGAVVTLTAKTLGAAYDYPLATASGYDTQHFSSPAFTITVSGSAMTGGSATTYATGTFTISGAEQTSYGREYGSFTVFGMEQATSSGTAIYSYAVAAGGYAPNGNLMAHSDSIMGDWGFQYDKLNRLTSMAPAQSPNLPAEYTNLIGCYGYDAFGNRTLAGLTAGDCTSTSAATATYNGNNQVTWTSVNSASGGFNYDKAGNVLNDGKNAYLYDGEGRLCAVDANYSVSPSYTQYIYDAGGARVAKGSLTSWPSSCGAPGTNGFALTNQYLLDQGGDQVAELNGTGGWAHSNVWAGAHLDATYDTNGLHFHLADPLGTRRVQANVYGVIEESFQSLPFGDGLTPVANPNCLTANHCYAEDATEHHFTGKERDSESGNDYFGKRYYASSMGRWMSPDKSLDGAIMELPQTWNKYSYEYNRPLYGTDPDGQCPPCIGAIIGGTIQGGFDLGKQLYNNGGSFSKVSWGEVGANAAGGAVAGAIAGATGGASIVANALVGDVAAGMTGNIVGGAVTGALDPNTSSDEVLSVGSVSSDALSGFVGGAGGHVAAEFVHLPDEPHFSMNGRNGRLNNQAYRTALKNLGARDQALNQQEVRSSLVHRGVDMMQNWLTELFFNKAADANTPPLREKVTSRICDENGNNCH